MDEDKKRAVIAYGIVGVVVIVGVVWFVVNHDVAKPLLPTGSSVAPVQQVPPLTISQGAFPLGIPSDLPISTDAAVIQNYQTNYPADQQQESVREYVTDQTLDVAVSGYQAYFRKNGWATKSFINTSAVKSLSVSKGFISLQIAFSVNTVLRRNSVAILANYYKGNVN